MKIYTRGGDGGETGTLGPERVDKDNIRMEALGNLDELNASIGCVMGSGLAPEIAMALGRVQHELFVVGAEVARTDAGRSAAIPRVTFEHVGRLEVDIDRLGQSLPELTEFILPGGDALAAALHLARAICRRAERSLVTLAREVELAPACLGYINRLSDLLFVMARYQNRHAGREDVVWQK